MWCAPCDGPRPRLWWILGASLACPAFAQSPSCALFKHGTFTQPGDEAGAEVRIVRRGNTQKERSGDHRSSYRVRWTDACTYQLFDRKVTHGEDRRPGATTDTLTVHITDTWEFGYSFRATSNFSDLEVVGTMELVQPKLGGVSFGP
ncbi:MAG: hypothetical protein JNL05_15805 [Flavobacteriales bacterium]|nr:hypothetical protein [Flavobacteriales bacterium]